jgi:hypothetical protein
MARHAGDRQKRRRGEPIGDHPALAPARELHHEGVVRAHDRDSIEGNLVGELAKGRDDVLERSVVIDVFEIDVRDHGDGGRQHEERGVALIRLGDEKIPRAEPRPVTVGADAPADDHRGVEPPRGQHRTDERGRRRLPVRAGDGHAIPRAHELGQHFRAPHDGDSPAGRLEELGIVGRDRR